MNKVVYHNFAPKAAEKAAFSSSESSEFSYIVKLTEERDVANFASFESLGINLLDDTLCLADDSDNVGFISTKISSRAKVFPEGGTKLTFDFNGYFTGPGITFHFWQNICPKLTAEFFRDGESLAAATINPIFLDFYYAIPVERFNKLTITFLESEVPEQFVKLRSIDLGNVEEITEFFGAIRIFEEIIPDRSDLPFDTCDFTAKVPDGITPQVGQSIYVEANGQPFGKFTVAELVDEENQRFEFKSNCDKSTLGDCSCPGLSTNTTRTVKTLVEEIEKNSDVIIDCEGFEDVQLNGSVEPDADCRFAAAMVAFGGGFFISSTRNTKLKIFKPRDKRQNVISSSRILDKAKFQRNAPYTSIQMYVPNRGSPYTVNNEKATGNLSTKVLTYDKFSLFTSAPDETLYEIAQTVGFERNEIKATIILDDERIGDIVRIETPYGTKTGIVKSLDIALLNLEKTADIVIIELEGYDVRN